MAFRDKHSYSKYRNKNGLEIGGSKVFVGPKVKYSFNPVINLPAKFWGNLLIFILILVGLYVLFFSSIFSVKDVVVEGNNLVLADDIASVVKKGDNIFRFNVNKTRSEITKKYSIIDDVQIYKGIPNTLKIVVLERTPDIVWSTGGKFYLIDNSGIIDKEITVTDYPDLIHITDTKNLPVKNGDQILSSQFTAFAKIVRDEFFDNTNNHITSYEVSETTFDLIVRTDSNYYVKFDTTRPVEKQLKDLKSILVNYRDKITEYVDVRVNGWVYYK